MKKLVLPVAIAMVALGCTVFKKTGRTKGSVGQAPAAAAVPAAKGDTVKRTKAYRDVITSKAITRDGLFKVHKVEERWFFEIAPDLFERDILVVNRVSKAPAGQFYGFAGDWISENLVKFAKGPGNKVFLKRLSYVDMTKDSSANGMIRSIQASTLEPIVASFDIKVLPTDSNATVIDVTDFISSDNDILFFHPAVKKDARLTGLQADKSYIADIRSFPLNTEIKTVKTYTAGTELVTYELNNSLVLLPATVMAGRRMDPRVGYFARGYRDYDNPQGVRASFNITRWKLEPKKEEVAKYLRGELVEPVKPIVFYIDPATPKKWVPYLIDGVNAWQKAFEKAGFKNAIVAKEAPINDSTWSIDDARHNVIVYKASVVQNASGPHVSDPRSGEILESHINWYHNVQQILHDWYFVQASPNDPAARNMKVDDALMGKLIRYVCTHEVGHTLGLQHNFAASSAVPVDSLRSKTYVAANGHTPSIMDYARFNYVAQPEDGIPVDDLIPRVAVYDEWAIEWGYRWFPAFQSMEAEQTYLNSWVIERQRKDKRLFFEHNMYPDPRNMMEDLGDDAMKAGAYGIKNLQRVIANLKAWTRVPNSDYDEMKRKYEAVRLQYYTYLNHVINNIGTFYFTPQTEEQGGVPFWTFPEKKKMQDAVEFIGKYFFQTPAWLYNDSLFAMGVEGADIIGLYKKQHLVLHILLNPGAWNALVFNETNLPAAKRYGYDELLTSLEKLIWSELVTGEKIEMPRRNLQKTYIWKLMDFTSKNKSGDMSMLDFSSIVRHHLLEMEKRITSAIPKYKDRESRLHLEDLKYRLKFLHGPIGDPVERGATIPESANTWNASGISLKDLENTWKWNGSAAKGCFRVPEWNF